ncbi:TonB-dependent receptor [Shewanella eurypsychrophilus]|uniref:TonB-dependent receptor n=1 Tax=Shewanella eurypsychrophilus TaxID=2593656 RepID=A0ABX6V6Q0_9GAMM|nr:MULTISPECIES: TonB-dependent receptor [Shewanella]QFU22245.1 TonB-dependent receptor plug domain-containing protein [Shewanella sp. YLB-09]QPG57531.1 TonB-dependent receptor [Shewanella eurypsychrophilus]
MSLKQMGLAVSLLCMVNVSSADDIERISVHGIQFENDGTNKNVTLGSDMTVISSDMIVQAGSIDINKILTQFVPGLFANGRAGRHTDTDYSLQGSRPQDILWLVDGNRLNNRLYGSTYTDTINPMMIERIEVIKGGQGVIYGSDAIAGVINIITKQYQGHDQGEVSMSVDSLPSYDAGAFVSAEVDNFQYTLSASTSQSEGYQIWPNEEYSPTAALDKTRGYQMNNFSGKLNWQANDQHSLTLFTQVNMGNLERPLAYNAILSENDREQILSHLDWQYQANDQLLLQTKIHYQEWDSHYSEITKDEQGNIDVPYWDAYWGFKDIGATISANYQTTSGSQWIAGAEFQQYEGADEVMEFVAEKDDNYAAYVQYQPHFDALPNTGLSVGVRFNRLSDSDQQWVGSLGMTHEIDNQWQVRGSIGNGYRQATVYELQSQVGTLGNPELESETSQNINLGLTFQGDTHITLDAFWRNVDNLIEATDLGNAVWQYNNVSGNVLSYGADVHLVTNFTQALEFEFSAGYANATREDTGEQINRVPEFTGFSKLNYQSSDALNFWFSGKYVGEFLDYGLTAGDYVLASAGAQYWLTGAQDQQLSLTIDNLFDSEITQSIFKHGHRAEYPIETLGAPRTFQMQYRYLF